MSFAVDDPKLAPVAVRRKPEECEVILLVSVVGAVDGAAVAPLGHDDGAESRWLSSPVHVISVGGPLVIE